MCSVSAHSQCTILYLHALYVIVQYNNTLVGCSMYYNAPLHGAYGKMRAEELLQALFVLLVEK